MVGTLFEGTVAQWNDLQLRYADEAADLWKGSVMIVTTGGNSVVTERGENFQEAVARCLRSQRCHKDEENQAANFDVVQDELEAFYTQLATEAGEGTVRVMGYPKIFNSNRLRCFIPGMSVREANFFDSLIDDMNERIMMAVDTVKTSFPGFDIQFVDVASYYSNGACSPFKFRQVRDINVAFRLSSFHPTQRGYDKSYDAFLDTVIV